MDINKELILKVARIARLNLTEDEVERFIPEFKEVFDLFSEIDGIDVKDEDLLWDDLVVKNEFRADVIGECFDEVTTFSNTDHKKNNFFQGPKIK